MNASNDRTAYLAPDVILHVADLDKDAFQTLYDWHGPLSPPEEG